MKLNETRSTYVQLVVNQTQGIRRKGRIVGLVEPWLNGQSSTRFEGKKLYISSLSLSLSILVEQLNWVCPLPWKWGGSECECWHLCSTVQPFNLGVLEK